MNSIQSANVEDPASYTEKCILERMKRPQDMTEYLLNILSVNCPNCDECITVPQKYICCSQLLQNNNHDERCMYKEN